MLLTVLPYLAALVAAAEVAPAPSAPPTKLQEIGRVRATICTPILVHANGAISQALDNDRAIAILTTNLRATNFDGLDYHRRKIAVNKLMQQAAQVRVSYRGADGEIKQLRTYAEQSTDPERKAELKAFADALGGAIQRQMRAVEAFDKAVVVMEGREAAIEARTLMPQPADPFMGSFQPPAYASGRDLPSWNDAMQTVAADMDTRVASIQIDEGVAADHSIAATTGC